MDEKLVKIIVSEDLGVQQEGSGQLNLIINPVYVLRAPFVPTALSIGLTIITSGFKEGNYLIEIKIKNTVQDMTIFNSGKNSVRIVPNLDNYNFTLNLKNLEFMSEGKYIVSFKIIDQDLQSANDASEGLFEDVFFVKANKVLG